MTATETPTSTLETCSTQETLQETCDSRGLTLPIDAAAGIIRGVKILGLESRNGRSYPPETLAAAAGLYEGSKVNINHPRGPADGPRDYRDRLGTLRAIQSRADGLYGDLCFNPKHPLAEQLGWDAEHAPENLGLSHNVAAEVRRDGTGKQVVERINRVNSVDLVADPATTRSLFEGTAADPAAILESLTAEQLRQARPDLVEELTAAGLAQLTEEIRRLEREAENSQRQQMIARLLTAAGLPQPASPAFLGALVGAATEQEIQALIEDRASAIRQAGARAPRSVAQGGDQPPVITSPKQFAAAITQ